MIALPTSLANWMYFDDLDRMGPEVSGVYTLAWRFTDATEDPWTKRINGFKAGNSAAWLGACRTVSSALRDLSQARNWNLQETALTVALGSADTKLVPTKPLPKLGAFVARELGLAWLPILLSKQPHRALHSLNAASERTEELEKAQYKSTVLPTRIKRVLVLDDMTTRGSTLTHIAGAIRKASPKMEVVGISLGKSERQSYAAGQGCSLSNDGVPEAWATLWEGA
jgi:hypothetical protein